MTYQENLYEVIGLSQDATQDVIERRCVELGEQYKSDKNSGDFRAAILFSRVERAYEILCDPVKRAAYDDELLSQSSKSAKRKISNRTIAGVFLMLAALAISGYAYIVQKERVERAAAEDAKRVAEDARKAAETVAKKVAEESARVLEAEARLAKERALVLEEQTRAAEDKVRQVANRADAEDLARVENLRAQCSSAGAAANRAGSAAGSFVGAQRAMPICVQAERAVKDRLRYEAIRGQDPVAAARELEAQRVSRQERAREERRRLVITNCNEWAPGHATCISR